MNKLITTAFLMTLFSASYGQSQTSASSIEYQRELQKWADRQNQELSAEGDKRIQKRLDEQRAIADQLAGDIDSKELKVEEFIEQIYDLAISWDERAINWLRKAAEQGSNKAQYYFGRNLARGLGMQQDQTRAENWLIQSARSGNVGALQELEVSLSWTRDKINIEAMLKPRCSGFGFEEGTDSHANCVMELQIAEQALAQARQLNEELQEQIATNDAAAIARKNAARQYQAQQQREREAVERQRAFGQALLGISAELLNPGSRSNSGGMYQSCNYNVMGEIVPFPVSNAGICPMSIELDGVTGTLR